MSSSLRRGGLAAAVIAFSIASLAACGAGNNAQTLEIKPDNAATTVGDIKVQNAIVITQPTSKASGPAVVSATLFNSATTAQKLDAITVDGGGTAKLKAAKGGSLTIPAGGYLILGGKGNASATLDNSEESVRNGDAQKVTFTFSETGDVSLRAFVVPAESYFEEWGPTEVPETPGAGSSASASPSESESPSASESASGSATPTDEASASESASNEAAAGH